MSILEISVCCSNSNKLTAKSNDIVTIQFAEICSSSKAESKIDHFIKVNKLGIGIKSISTGTTNLVLPTLTAYQAQSYKRPRQQQLRCCPPNESLAKSKGDFVP